MVQTSKHDFLSNKFDSPNFLIAEAIGVGFSHAPKQRFSPEAITIGESDPSFKTSNTEQ